MATSSSLADVFANDIIEHSVDLLRFSASVRKDLLGILFKLREDLVNKLTTMGGFDGLSVRQKAARLSRLVYQTEGTIRSAYKNLRDEHMSQMVPLAKLEAKFVSNMFKDAFNVNVLSSRLTVEKLKAVARGTVIQGAPSEEWWGRQAADLRNSFSDQMNMGYLQDETVQDLVVRVRGAATGSTVDLVVDGEAQSFTEFSGGIMDVSTRQAEALVRTSIQNIANDVRMQTYEANSDIIKGVQALATLDTRTTDLCRARDHKSWEQDDLGDWVPVGDNDEDWPGPPPWHWNCRTTFLPITYSWSELASGSSKSQQKLAAKVDDNTDEGFRASMDGQVAQSMNYDEWLQNQTVATQKEVLGPGRYDLWQGGNGKLTFEQMIDQRGNPITLAQLQAKYN